MQTARYDLANRRPVWEALSTLFLDTDVSDHRQWRAEMLANSPYSLQTLEQILIDEVYPVCMANLLSVAGVWDGFDTEWQEHQILRHLKSRWSLFRRLKFGKQFATKDQEWQATKIAIAKVREQSHNRI